MKAEGRAECAGEEALFEDLDFPADDTSLLSDSSTPIARLQGDVTWRRPQVKGKLEMPLGIPYLFWFVVA